MSRRLPTIHGITEHELGPYRMERLDLEFGNGERRRFERLHGRGHGAVIVVPMLDADTVLLVREYAAGMHRYELGLVKGRIDAGEAPEQAANRELQEEAGYAARSLQVLRSLTLAPVYMSHAAHLVLARDLYPQRLPGDEPEELEVVPWRLDRLHELILREDFSEGRSIAALFIVREWLQLQAGHQAGVAGRGGPGANLSRGNGPGEDPQNIPHGNVSDGNVSPENGVARDNVAAAARSDGLARHGSLGRDTPA